MTKVTKKAKPKEDVNQYAKSIVDMLTGEKPKIKPKNKSLKKT